MSEKSQQIVKAIIDCDNGKEAVVVIKDIIKALNMNQDSETINGLVTGLDALSKTFEDLESEYRGLEIPKPIEEVQRIRTEANFIYRQLADEFVFPVSRLKTLFDEKKTTERAKGLNSLKEDEKYSNIAKSSLRDYLGAAENYQEWMNNFSIVYGAYSQMRALMDSIKQFTDSLASEIRSLQQVEVRDAK